MKKLGLIIPLTVLGAALFSVIAFVIPFHRGTNFWIGYGFGLFAILYLGLIAYMSNSSTRTLQSRFYGWHLIGVAGIYTIVQLIVSLLLFSIPVLPVWLGVVVCSVLLILSLCGSITTQSANDTIEKIDSEVKEKVFYIRSLEVDIGGMAARCSDLPMKRELEKLREKIRYSDPMSSSRLATLEESIQTRCEYLGELITRQDYGAALATLQQIERMLQERNEKCKLLK